MELLFESRPNIHGMSGHLVFFQHRPTVDSEFVVRPDTPTDCRTIIHYGTVLRDGGKLRMWYLAYDDGFGSETLGGNASVAYAESTDGIRWTKPPLGLVKTSHAGNNLTNLGLHSATIFIDPTAPPTHRYRAVGCGRRLYYRINPGVTTDGYYTAHSADGLDWQLDSTTPTWDWIDVVTSVWHPGRNAGMIALKVTPTVHRIARRSIHTAELRDGVYTPHVAALYADEADDFCATQRGFGTCDYYGMGMLPAGKAGTVGFLWRFMHALPYSKGWGNGPQALYGRDDICLTYQPEAGARWFHMPGRPLFIAREDTPWPNGWVYTSSSPVEVGDEHWLSIGGHTYPHGYGRNDDWTAGPLSKTTLNGGGVIFARWPKWRLFGFEANPDATLAIRLGEITQPSEVLLNYEIIDDGGSIMAELETDGGMLRVPVEADRLTGSAVERVLTWNGVSTVAPTAKARIKLTLDRARVYAYDVRPCERP